MGFCRSRCILVFPALLLLGWIVGVGAAQDAPKKAEPRTWKAAEGGYQVKAVLLDHKNGFVQLKKDDGLVVTVPVSKLSKPDQDYLVGLEKKTDPFSGGVPAPVAPVAGANPKMAKGEPLKVPDGDARVLPGEGLEVSLSTAKTPEPIEPDPMPPLLKLKPGSVHITTTDAYDKASGLAVVDPRSALVALTLSRNVHGRPTETRGRLMLGTLPSGPFQTVVDTDQTIHLLDHHAGTGQTLVVSGSDGFHRGGELQVIENLAQGKPVVTHRFLMPGHEKPGFKPKAEKAWLLAKDLGIVQVNDALYCWNFARNELIYRTARNSVNTTRTPAFSGGRRYFALPVATGFHLIESATGADLGFVNPETIASGGFAFHPDGKQIAVASSNAWAVYDCSEAKLTKSGVVAAHLHNKLDGWIDNHCFLTSTGAVMDVNAGMVVWNYYIALAEAKHIWQDSISIVSKHGGLQIYTVPMPEPRATKAIADLPKKAATLMVTQPGTEVKVVISVEDADADELQTALETAITNAGWKVNPNAKLAIIATIGRGKPYELKYRDRAGLGGQVHNVKINPFTATLQIRDANSVLWKRETENHIPRMLFLRGGETVEQAVKRYEKPQPSFFSSMRIPPSIPRPSIANGLGRSRLDKGQWVDFPFTK